jgi:hypothetical protein
MGRGVVLGLVLALAAVVSLAAQPLGARTTRRTNELALCGVERWAVKTLQDRPRLLPVYRTTVRQLVRLPRPAYLPNTRLPIERHVYSVIASATLLREEADQDLHVILRSGPYHMVSESPNAPCGVKKLDSALDGGADDHGRVVQTARLADLFAVPASLRLRSSARPRWR